jgi:nicotinamidase-related amidase
MRSHTISTFNQDFPIDLDKTALLIIDMQNDFCHPDSLSGELGLDLTAIHRMIPNLQQLLDWARQQHLLIIFTKESHLADLSDLTPSKKLRYANAGSPIGTMGKRGRYLVQNEWGSQIISELQPLPGEYELNKPAHSVLVNSEVEPILHQHSITHLLITGVTTQCCVLATYRHASDLGFYCLLLEDCCAAFTERDHQAAIDVILAENGVIGWVGSSSHLLQLYQQGPGTTS